MDKHQECVGAVTEEMEATVFQVQFPEAQLLMLVVVVVVEMVLLGYRDSVVLEVEVMAE